ncbi:MAG: DUF488 family protein, N3 subclade [Acidimicrobiales bacterium]
MAGEEVSDAVYGRLLALRTGLRHFERWSEQQARAAGLTPAQHQLLLAVSGHDDARGPTIGEVADYLLLRHHSVVGLIDRADAAGLLTRRRDRDDQRVVRLRLTRKGSDRLRHLSELHLEELERLAPRLPLVWRGLGPVQGPHGISRTPSGKGVRSDRLDVARVYDEIGRDPGPRVLVDRVWPRGLARADAPFGTWAKEVAPSAELRRWYGYATSRRDEFERRYRKELAKSPARQALRTLRQRASTQRTVLLTATKELDRSPAAVLRRMLAER